MSSLKIEWTRTVTLGHNWSPSGLIKALRARNIELRNVAVLKKIALGSPATTINLVRIALKELTGSDVLLEQELIIMRAMDLGLREVPAIAAVEMLLQEPDLDQDFGGFVATKLIQNDKKRFRIGVGDRKWRPFYSAQDILDMMAGKQLKPFKPVLFPEQDRGQLYPPKSKWIFCKPG